MRKKKFNRGAKIGIQKLPAADHAVLGCGGKKLMRKLLTVAGSAAAFVDQHLVRENTLRFPLRSEYGKALLELMAVIKVAARGVQWTRLFNYHHHQVGMGCSCEMPGPMLY